MDLWMKPGVTSDAIAFFCGNDVVKEMLYPEFQAILDHVVGLPEFKGHRVRAAYIRVNTGLEIVAAVLFEIDFDASGYVHKSWNIPLQSLADNAGRGPDLGAGPIKLACRSQCSISWHQRSLWDPDYEVDINCLQVLAATVKRNRLGLIYEPNSEELLAPPVLSEAFTAPVEKALDGNQVKQLTNKYQQDLKRQAAELLDEHKLRLATMRSEAQDQLDKQQKQYLAEKKKLIGSLDTAKRLFAEEKHRNFILKKKIDQQAIEFKQAREQLQRQIERDKDVEQCHLLDLEEKFEREAQAKIDTMTTEITERLNMREVEVFYRDEQIKRINQELVKLREEKQSLIDNTGDNMLKKLIDNGINFVIHQPGLEGLSIPLCDISRYLESPQEYVAEKCSVDLSLYNQWLEHYELPICRYQRDDGSRCGDPVLRVEKPSRFISGDSDYCIKHGRPASALSGLMKVRESH